MRKLLVSWTPVLSLFHRHRLRAARAVALERPSEGGADFELYQGLQDQNVPARLIVYQGFGGIGHGPTKPKSHRATMDHNVEWFDQHLFQIAPRPTSDNR
jgi:hypothetical protein